MQNNYAIQPVKTLNFSYMVFSLSYQSPLDEHQKLEIDLKNRTFAGPILFDMLICFGDSFNRFICINFNGEKFDFESLKIVDPISAEIKIISSDFYNKNFELINPYTLSRQQLYKIHHGIPF